MLLQPRLALVVSPHACISLCDCCHSTRCQSSYYPFSPRSLRAASYFHPLRRLDAFTLQYYPLLSLLLCFEVTYVVEDILLCNSCIAAEAFRVQLAVEVIVNSPSHPYVNGKRL